MFKSQKSRGLNSDIVIRRQKSSALTLPPVSILVVFVFISYLHKNVYLMCSYIFFHFYNLINRKAKFSNSKYTQHFLEIRSVFLFEVTHFIELFRNQRF